MMRYAFVRGIRSAEDTLQQRNEAAAGPAGRLQPHRARSSVHEGQGRAFDVLVDRRGSAIA